jgi:hypothetical protein
MESIRVMDYLKSPILLENGSRFFWTNCVKTSNIPIEDLIKIYDRKHFDMVQIDKNHFRFIGSAFSNSFEEFYISNRENHFFIIVSEKEYKQFSKNIMQDYSREVQLLAAAKYNL